MNKRNEDCYYFYNSTCNKGKDCEYRHCVEALESNEICKYWQKRRDCSHANCRFRHALKSSRDRKKIQCYHETQEGCMKIHCPYFHQKTRDLLLKEIKLGSNKVIFPVKDGSQALQIPLADSQRTEISETIGGTKKEIKPTAVGVPLISHPPIFLPSIYRPPIYLPPIYRQPIYLPSTYVPSIYLPSTSFQSSIKNTKKENQNQQGVFNETEGKNVKKGIKQQSKSSTNLIKERDGLLCKANKTNISSVQPLKSEAVGTIHKFKPVSKVYEDNIAGVFNETEGKNVKKSNKNRSKSCTNLIKERDGLLSKRSETDIASVQPLQSEAVGTINNFKPFSKVYEDLKAALARDAIDNLSLNPKDKGQDMKKKSRGRRSSANPK